jgi:hypothetical protein
MFLAPAFLLGLLAIGVPIWLHRVARANPTQHQFASLMLLEASETQRTARRTLRYWLLLAMRIALLAALVFAFAGPMVKENLVPAADANARLHAIVLDTSLSMQFADRWTAALDAAEDALDEVGPGDRVMLVTGAGQRIDVVQLPIPARDEGVLRAKLRGLKPGVERFDYGLAMSTADNWLGSPRPPVVMHLVSDFQRRAAPLRFADLEPPPGTQLALLDVSGDGASDNSYIQSAALASADTRSLQVELRTTALQPQRRQVVLQIDDREYARKEVEIPATSRPVQAPITGEGSGELPASLNVDAGGEPGSTTVLFSDLKLAAGTHRIEVAIEPRDRLPQDDVHYAVIEHADPKALLVARNGEMDDATYFASAIGSLTAPRLTVEQRSTDGLDRGTLSGYSLVVVTDVAALSSGAAERVTEYVAAGGAVLATVGAESSNRNLALLDGVRVGEARTRLSLVGEIAQSHPVLREAGDWHRVRFFRQRPVEVTAADRVLITHDDGTPLLIERSIGAGRVLLLTAPIDRSWNDLAIHPLFVQFIGSAARYLTGPDTSAASATVGSAVMTGLTAAGGGQIFDPQGKRVLGLAQASVERLMPDRAGFYEIRGGERVRWLAVNVDARESDLTPMSAAFVQRWQEMVARPRPAANIPAAARTGTAARPLGPSLMWLAALLLLGELLLANRHLAIRREVPK